jgi:GH43 family beta-xylosidase
MIAHDAARDTFTNPLLPSGPDPWVTQQDGVYYYTNTLGNRIALWRTTDITDLVHAEKRTVWTPPATGPNARSIWAPELHRLNGRWYILEGPEFLEGPDGRVFMTYSAGACWSDNYALGLMEAKRGGDLLSPKSWTKSPVPVLSSANGVYATGHNGFFRSPDGHEQWIIYHANPAAGMGCTSKRAPYISKVSWNDGAPVFAPPAPAGTRLRKPAGTGHGNINASRRPMP